MGAKTAREVAQSLYGVDYVDWQYQEVDFKGAEEALRSYAESIREECARKVEGFKEDDRPDVAWKIDVQSAASAIRSLEIP